MQLKEYNGSLYLNVNREKIITSIWDWIYEVTKNFSNITISIVYLWNILYLLSKFAIYIYKIVFARTIYWNIIIVLKWKKILCLFFLNLFFKLFCKSTNTAIIQMQALIVDYSKHPINRLSRSKDDFSLFHIIHHSLVYHSCSIIILARKSQLLL